MLQTIISRPSVAFLVVHDAPKDVNGQVFWNAKNDNPFGRVSTTTTFSASRPAIGPVPKTRRHAYPSYSSTKIFGIVCDGVSQTDGAYSFITFMTDLPVVGSISCQLGVTG